MSTISDDWRLKGNDWLVHLELTRKPYTQWSEEWDHDHCLFCWAKFMDPDSSAVVHLKYPLRHRKRWRSTNQLERSLGEVRRRTKVIGRFPGETSCLSLCFAVLDLVISNANNVKFSELDVQALARIERERTATSGGEAIAA